MTARKLIPLAASALFVVLILGAVALTIGRIHAGAAAEAAAERAALTVPRLPVAVEAVVPEPGYRVERRYLGLVTPRRQVALAFDLGGRLESLGVEIGEEVAAGQPLARLDTRRLAARRAELEAALREAEAALAFAEGEAGRQRTLAQRGSASAQARDRAVAEAQVARARRDSLAAQLDSLAVDEADSLLRAPFAGVVVERALDEGAVVTVGTTVFRLLELQRPEARIGLPAAEAARLVPGDELRVAWRGGETRGRLRALIPEVAGGTRTAAALVALEPLPGLASGDAVELILEREVAEPGFWVPSAALVAGERGLWALQLVEAAEAGDRVRRAAVEVLHVEGARSFVRGTLAAGDRIVVEGAQRVRAGQLVEAALHRASLE